MKRGASTIECIDIPDVRPVRTRRAKRVRKVIKRAVIKAKPVVKKVSLEERRKQCRLLLDFKPKGHKVVKVPPFMPYTTFSEIPLAPPKPDCMAGAIAPAAPVFSTLFKERHTIPYPYTHEWTVAPTAVKTVWDFNTVNRANVKVISFAREQDQKLLLTKS